MDTSYLVIGGGVLAVLLLIVIFINNYRTERKGGTAFAAPRRAGAPSPALSQRVKDIASHPGRKIAAIKAYREETGAGLKDAKDAVEAWLASGERPGEALQHGAAYSPSPSGPGASFQTTLSQHVKDIARNPGRKIEAIKAYREETRVGLREAKDAVEAWRRSQGLE